MGLQRHFGGLCQFNGSLAGEILQVQVAVEEEEQLAGRCVFLDPVPVCSAVAESAGELGV